MNHQVRFDEIGAVTVVVLAGEIDLANAADLGAEIERRVVDDDGRVRSAVVDLTDVHHFDSTGVRMLFRAATTFASHGISARVVRPRSDALAEVLEVAQVDRVVPVDDSVRDAVAALTPAS
ncbi:MAG: STAS domain-containing protein [Actinomycetota bacterium]|nr:STAS domain-containing protein [Actinomycetota bacterium]